ncbi:hypothetical protein [Eubacterium sp.]|uniref:hypothetical protein n=1 Tax=uncultured Eubacterium sp. TaxID=165185 RepID=UPI0025D4960E|nr:hypothetical protein [uncultured Eubacterium sp.]
MKRFYTEPELEIRKYSLQGDVVTTSDLNKDDTYEILGGNSKNGSPQYFEEIN